MCVPSRHRVFIACAPRSRELTLTACRPRALGHGPAPALQKLKRATSGQRLLDATSVANGVLDWFDLACEKQLLYDPERKQYTQHCAKVRSSRARASE